MQEQDIWKHLHRMYIGKWYSSSGNYAKVSMPMSLHNCSLLLDKLRKDQPEEDFKIIVELDR